MFAKQKEIDSLKSKLENFEFERVSLVEQIKKLYLQNSSLKEELRKTKKLLNYYPQDSNRVHEMSHDSARCSQFDEYSNSLPRSSLRREEMDYYRTSHQPDYLRRDPRDQKSAPSYYSDSHVEARGDSLGFQGSSLQHNSNTYLDVNLMVNSMPSIHQQQQQPPQSLSISSKSSRQGYSQGSQQSSHRGDGSGFRAKRVSVKRKVCFGLQKDQPDSSQKSVGLERLKVTSYNRRGGSAAGRGGGRVILEPEEEVEIEDDLNAGVAFDEPRESFGMGIWGDAKLRGSGCYRQVEGAIKEKYSQEEDEEEDSDDCGFSQESGRVERIDLDDQNESEKGDYDMDASLLQISGLTKPGDLRCSETQDSSHQTSKLAASFRESIKHKKRKANESLASESQKSSSQCLQQTTTLTNTTNPLNQTKTTHSSHSRAKIPKTTERASIESSQSSSSSNSDDDLSEEDSSSGMQGSSQESGSWRPKTSHGMSTS